MIRGRTLRAILRAAGASAALLALDGAPAAPRVVPAGIRSASVRPAPADAVRRAVVEDAPLPIGFIEIPQGAAPPPVAVRLVEGPMEEVLYGSAAGPVAAQAIGLFAHRLDMTRDLQLGDRVRLLVRETPGRSPWLDYAEIDGRSGPVRLYRRSDDAWAGGPEAFAGEDGEGLDRVLLRTPLAVRRVTSPYGMRLHPLLGYSRLHRGVDFAAAPGVPVLAAGDGWVETARWAGDYGRMARLRHGARLETLYAHLSAFAPGIEAGAAVRQGQVIGWSGASGLVTGPHLHFEVIEDGRPVDPALVRPPAAGLPPAARQAFEARKTEIDARLAQAAG